MRVNRFMKVARAYALDDIRIEEVPIPSIAPDEALMRVETCGLCTSDCLDWYVAQKAPIVLGHEPTGILVQVGSQVEDFAEGDRVFTHHHVSCGTCAHCRRRAETSCSLFRSTKLDPGGFAEYVRIPGENLRRDTLKLSPEMDFETGTFIEPLACSLRALRKAPPLSPEDSVLIIGLGSMGLLNGMAARAKGCGLLLGCDLNPVRNERALEFGFDATFDPTRTLAADQVRERTDGRGADLVIVGPGSVAAIEQGIACAAPGAFVVLFTPTPAEMLLSIFPHQLYFGEITLTASYSCAPGETREAQNLLESRAVKPGSLVSFRTGLKGLSEAVSRTLRKDWDLKAVIYPGSARLRFDGCWPPHIPDATQ